MRDQLAKLIASTCSELFGTEVQPVLTRPEAQFGDFSTNVALQLAKQLGKNPRELAEQLAEKLKQVENSGLSDVAVAGPGFLNLTLTDETLLQTLAVRPAQSLKGQVIVVEYSDPNPFKVLHAGHLYTSIVGDAIANTLETAGATVHRTNFGGDVGLHVAKSMWGIIKELGGEEPAKLNKVGLEDLDFRAGWMAQRYTAGHEAYENDEAAKARIAHLNKKIYELQAKDDHTSQFAQIYWTCRQWSYEYFEHFYETIRVKPFHYYPESKTAPYGTAKAKELLQQGVLQESDGAVVFIGEKYGLHTRVFLTSEGLPTYEAKDLGLIFEKYQDYQFDRSLVITGNDIVEYMKVVLKVVEQTAPDLAAATTHLTHGMVKLAGGQKMSSREGNVVQALDVISSAAAATRKMHALEDRAIEQDIILGAVKYSFLKNRIGGDITYDPEESVSLEGNSGPYLQYSHARARSILQKAGSQEEGIRNDAELNSDERSLVRKIGEYAETIDRSVSELMPHHICTYLYELAQVFNRFYEHNRVIGDKRQALRLGLVSNYADTLQNGLTLLGIASPDKM